MITGIVASVPTVGVPGGGGPVDLTEPWGEVARSSTIASGKLTVSGLDLSLLKVVRLYISGVRVTTDDSHVGLRFLIDGAEVATGYRGAQNTRTMGAGTSSVGGTGQASIPLTRSSAGEALGNAAAENLQAVVTIYSPSSATLFKRAFVRATWYKPNGDGAGTMIGGGALDSLGAITGFSVVAASDLTAGHLIAVGVE